MLLLPRALESFILRDQAEDLLSAPGMVAVEPARISYGAYLRLPVSVGDGLAATQARRLKLPGVPRVIVIFHPLQYPLARGLIAQHPDAELWYWQWDRFDSAYDASPRQRERLEDLHLAASLRASVNVVVTDALGELVDEEGGAPLLVPLAADSFPAPDPGATVVAVSLGPPRPPHGLEAAAGGRRGDAGARAAADRRVARGRIRPRRGLPGLPGARPTSSGSGRRSDEEAARLIACADVGIVPFERSDFNETGLPYRILKYARLGRRTVSRDLKGVRTWAQAVTTAETPEEWISALRAHAGARVKPDAELREWALVPDRARAEPAAVGAAGDAGDRERAAGQRAGEFPRRVGPAGAAGELPEGSPSGRSD